MRKYIISVFVMMAILSLSACKNAEDELDNNKAEEVEFKDGEYTGKGDEWEYGYETAVVTIEEGDIVSITLHRMTLEGEEVDYANWTGEEIDGRTYPNLKQYRLDMAAEMIEQQDANVDTIAGATVSTANWIVAVERALDKARN